MTRRYTEFHTFRGLKVIAEFSLKSISPAPDSNPRQVLRRQLAAHREQFVTGPTFDAAQAALARHLTATLQMLEPALLGVYQALSGEFDVVRALAVEPAFADLPLALPHAERRPVRLHYRAWDRRPPTSVDDCGIASADGPPVEPDVVLVPCLGFTVADHRLGYGGGYFDRWLAAHPAVTAVGVAWQIGMIDAAAFAAEAHDRPLMTIVTERGTI